MCLAKPQVHLTSPRLTICRFQGSELFLKRTGSFELLHDLSSPDSHSVNDAIPIEQFSLHYDSVDTAIAAIMRLGPGAFLTKVDIRNAFRLCPIRPEDWHLVGIKWGSKYYHEKVLPFGMQSSPYIFNQFASSLNWILSNTCKLPDVMHYLDNFLDICAPDASLAACHKEIFLSLFSYLNVPVAPEKVEGPATVLTFLGLELDTVLREIRLPPTKLAELRALVDAALKAAKVSKRELRISLGPPLVRITCCPSGPNIPTQAL